LLLPLLTAAFVTTVTLIVAMKMAPAIGLVDDPEGRKQHKSPTPMVGGIALTAGLMSLYFTLPHFFEEHWVLFICILAVMLLGLLDDLFEIHSALRMLVQIGVGIAIHFEANLPFKSVGDIWFIGDLGLGPFSLTFTCIAVVGGINAVNMMDGLDGLCGTVVGVAVAFVGAIAYLAGDMEGFTFSLAILAVLVAFLLFNYRFPWNQRARVFLGDSGAYLLGFLIAALFLMTSQGSYKGGDQVIQPVTALWLLFIPLIDIAHVIWIRGRAGRWPVSDDRLHVHYLLLDREYSVLKTVNSIGVAAIALGLTGIALQMVGVGESWSYTIFMTGCVIYFIVTNRMVRRASE
jgi:UDP-GlcNAc:undecaprenyl-phosphate GlcNAc-1-phosphate transferase